MRQLSARSAQCPDPSAAGQGTAPVLPPWLLLLTGCEAKNPACSPHAGGTATRSDISACWFVSDDKSMKQCSCTRGPRRTATHGQA